MTCHRSASKQHRGSAARAGRAAAFLLPLCIAALAALQVDAAPRAADTDSCRSAEDVRERFYSAIWDGDLVACVNQVSHTQLPEKAVMLAVTYVRRGEYAAARASIPADEDSSSSIPLDLRRATRLFIASKETLGVSPFSSRIRLEDHTSSAIIRDPLKFDPALLLLPLLDEDSDFDVFQQFVNKIQVREPGRIWPFMAKGARAVLADRPSMALAELSFALSISRTNATLRYWLARAYELERQFEKAYDEYSAFIELSDRPCQGYVSRAVLLGALRRWDAAVDDASAAIRQCVRTEGVLQAYQNRATSYRYLGDHDAAARDYQHIIANGGFRRRFIAQNDLASLLMAKGDVAGGCRTFVDLGKAVPTYFKVHSAPEFVMLLKNLSTCLGKLPTLLEADVEYYLEQWFSLLGDLSSKQRREAAIDMLFGIMDIHEKQRNFIHGNIDRYYELCKAARRLEGEPGYAPAIDLLFIFGGRPDAVAEAFERLKGTSIVMEAFGLFIVDRFLKTRGLQLSNRLMEIELPEIRARAMKDDTARSTYFSVRSRYP